MFCKALTTLVVMSVLGSVHAKGSSCKYIPGDHGWPSSAKWAQLNKTVGGRLIQTVPLASVCHQTPFDDYDPVACQALQASWTSPAIYEDHPAEIMNPYYQNTSCIPFTTPANQTCTLGNYASYSINVTRVADVQAGIQFARQHNIRLVIKNTGHDFMGKSTGTGSLSLWMHNMNTTTVIENYSGPTYKGPAAKLQPGVIAGNVYSTVAAAGYRIIGGSCLSVGLAGGYTAGAGHSLLNNIHGMAADAVLEWEVVTAEGKHLVATPTQNSDLYWALSGGGAGTYAVAISMTTKLFPESQIGSGSLSFNDSIVGNQTFWEGVGDLLAFYTAVADAPGGMDFQVANNTLLAENIVIPDKTAEETADLFAPFLSQLEQRGIPYTFTPETFDSYYDHVVGTLSPLPYGPYPTTIQLTTRLIPRSSALDPERNADIMAALASPVETGLYAVGCRAINVANATHPHNAVLPQWRDAVALCTIVGNWDWDISWDENQARKVELVNQMLPALDAVTPGAGSYLNEIDAEYQGDWRKELYGTNYNQLLSVKNKYDPEHLLYAHFAVGMDYWKIDSSGRLCSA